MTRTPSLVAPPVVRRPHRGQPVDVALGLLVARVDFGNNRFLASTVNFCTKLER